MRINGVWVLLIGGWTFAALGAVGLLAQHGKWREQESHWAARDAQQLQKQAELERVIAELNLALDDAKQQAASRWQSRSETYQAKTYYQETKPAKAETPAPAQERTAGQAVNDAAARTGAAINRFFDRVKGQ